MSEIPLLLPLLRLLGKSCLLLNQLVVPMLSKRRPGIQSCRRLEFSSPGDRHRSATTTSRHKMLSLFLFLPLHLLCLYFSVNAVAVAVAVPGLIALANVVLQHLALLALHCHHRCRWLSAAAAAFSHLDDITADSYLLALRQLQHRRRAASTAAFAVAGFPCRAEALDFAGGKTLGVGVVTKLHLVAVGVKNERTVCPSRIYTAAAAAAAAAPAGRRGGGLMCDPAVRKSFIAVFCGIMLSNHHVILLSSRLEQCSNNKSAMSPKRPSSSSLCR